MYGQATADSHHGNPTGWKRWAYSTNHKDIGTMYLIFAIIAGIIGSLFSVLMRKGKGAKGVLDIEQALARAGVSPWEGKRK